MKSKSILNKNLFGLVCLTLAACGDGESGSREPADGGDQGPLYLVQARLTVGDERVHYFTPVESLEADTPFDISDGLEQAGNARLFAEPGVGMFMLGTGEDATITRVEVDAEGAFHKGERVSFASLGVTSLAYRAVTFIDDERALYRDDSQLQVIEWNPKTMRISRTIPLPKKLLRAGLTAVSGSAAVRRKNRVLFPLMWFGENVASVPSDVALVSVNLESGKASATIDSRCPVGGVTFTDPEGDTYFFNQLTSVYAERLFDDGRASCALRIRAGETSFDPDYLLELDAFADGATTAPVAWGGGTRVWFRALDEELFDPAEGTTYAEFFAGEGWRLWRADVTRPDEPAVRDDSPAASCCGTSYVVDGTPFGQELKDGVATLMDLSGDKPAPMIEVPEFIADVVRLR